MSPFFHYNSRFDAQELMRRYAAPDLRPTPGYLTNFLGVLIDPNFHPDILAGRDGEVEDVPIPANWHADIAEWGAALRALELADASRSPFAVVELGCGWGCWINNIGVAARRRGFAVRLVGVDSDPIWIEHAKACCRANGFSEAEVAMVCNTADAALLERVFERMERIDLLHIDIQGAEANLIEDAASLLASKVAYLVIGTHSRPIEGRLFEALLASKWQLEIERPAILSMDAPPSSIPKAVVDGVRGWLKPLMRRLRPPPEVAVTVDGVQGWRNPRLLP